MLGNLIALLILIVLVVLFGWLARRAWLGRRAFVRWPGAILSGLMTLVLALVTVLAARGFATLYTLRKPPVPTVQVSGTAQQIARGQHLATVICVDCHATNGQLPLTGGKNLSEDTGLPLGSIVGPNLTPGGPLANWSDGEIIRAIRQTTSRDGRPLLMPAQGLAYLSDEDAQALVTYLRSQLSIEKQTPPIKPSFLLAVLIGAGVFNLDLPPADRAVANTPQGPTAQHGAYIVNLIGCRNCHGQNLEGGKPPAPPGPSLHIIAGWKQEDFVKSMRTGVDPSGHKLQPIMPWQSIGRLDDGELAALYEYLHNLPPDLAATK